MKVSPLLRTQPHFTNSSTTVRWLGVPPMQKVSRVSQLPSPSPASIAIEALVWHPKRA